MTDYEMSDEDKEVLAASLAVLGENTEDIEAMIDEIMDLGPDGCDADCHVTGEIAVALYNIVSILVDAAVDAGIFSEEEMQKMMDQYSDDNNRTLH